MVTAKHASPVVLVIGPLPPPLHGQSQNTRRVATDLGKHTTVRVLDTSPGSLRRGPFYHLRKLLRIGKAALALSRAPKNAKTAVYLSLDSGLGLAYQVGLCLLARSRGLGLFLHHRSFAYIDRRSRLMSMVVSASGRSATHIFLCAHMHGRFAGEYGAPARYLIVSNAAHAPAAATLRPRKSGMPLRLGLLGNLCFDKGLHDFTQVLDTCVRETLDVTGILAGPAVSSADARHIAAARDRLGDRLRYLGPLAADARQAFYGSIDLFVFATRYRTEAQPNVLLEAMAHGVPSIAFDRGCIRADLSEGAGTCVPTDADFRATTLAVVRRLIGEPGALDAARAAALEQAQRHHARARVSYERFIREISGRDAPLPIPNQSNRPKRAR